VDAFLGREGRRLSAEQVRAFYASAYLERNPDLDVGDAAYKAGHLIGVCEAAGVRPSSLLEVGCGSGEILVRMAQALGALRAVGADYSPTIADVARRRTGLEIALFDGARLPFPDREFSLVYFADVLEHVLSPVDWLREVARVAEKIAFLVPLESGLFADPIYTLRRARGKPTNLEQYGHIWRFYRHQVAAIFAKAGIRVEALRAHCAPLQLDGFNRLGRALERARHGVARISPRGSEVLFGGVALVGVAAPR
jgi:ubiquinone/menaquinone biosynthesis C-methylase UbiE